MLYPFKVSLLTRLILKGFIWRIDHVEKKIFLTFDDGPVPQVTPWVLKQLDDYGAKATFFCVGENITKHPRTYEKLLAAGHTTANHTYNHLSGTAVTAEEYIENVWKAERLIGTRLFRPPYGRLTPKEYRILKKDFRIVLSDVLIGDFDPAKDSSLLKRKAFNNIENGSIVLFHDSIKAVPRTKAILPDVLRAFSEDGYSFCALNPASENLYG